MNEPEITIIICTYNGGRRLAKVIQNIYREKNLENYVSEVIVVNNNSTDDTKEIIEENMIKYSAPPVRYCYEEKVGLSNARKRGVYECKTKWIAFLDDDNYVEPQWVEKIIKYIECNKNVGVFNGAVIPFVNFQMTIDEEQKLRASLKVLACTHYDKQELKNNPSTPFRNPIGAGMVILSDPLKVLLKKGWLKSPGRTKDNLASGEDGEMAYWVKSCGYQFGFCPDAILYHEMSHQRLENTYLKRIWYEIGRGVGVVMKKQRFAKMKNVGYRILLEMRMKSYQKSINKYEAFYYSAYIEGYEYEWKH